MDFLRRAFGPTPQQFAATSPGGDTPRPTPRQLQGGPLVTSMMPPVPTASAAADVEDLEAERRDPALAQLPDPAVDPGPVPPPRHLTTCSGYPGCDGCPTCPRCRRLVVGLHADEVCSLCEGEVGVRPRCCGAFPLCDHDTETARDARIVERARQLGDEIDAEHPAIAAVVAVLGRHDLSRDTGEDDGGGYPATCFCGWDGPEERYDQHLAQQLAIAGVLRAPLQLRDPNRITDREVHDLAALLHLADITLGFEPDPDEPKVAAILLGSGRVYLVPPPPRTEAARA